MAKLPSKRRKPLLPSIKDGSEPSQSSIQRSYASLAEDTFGASGYCGKSLLRTIVGKVRPRAGTPKNSLLVVIIQEKQGVYAALLGRLMCGASLSGAAAAVGLQRETVRSWMVQGLSDLAIDKDSYYSRFSTDCRAAFAHSVSEAEIAVHRRNPLEYLRTGPGRAFYQGKEEYWQEISPQAPLPDNDIEPLAILSHDEQQAQSALPDDRRAQAVEELRKLGILQNPQFVQQLESNLNTVAASTSNKGQIVDSIPPAQVNTKCTDVPGTQ